MWDGDGRRARVEVVVDATLQAWTFETYWLSVLGARRADQVVAEFHLVDDGLDEWLGEAEAEAAIQADRADYLSILDAWVPFQRRALDELRGAVERAEDEVTDEPEWSGGDR